MRLGFLGAIFFLFATFAIGSAAALADGEEGDIAAADPANVMTEQQTAVVELQAALFPIMQLCEPNLVEVAVQVIGLEPAPESGVNSPFLVVALISDSGFARYEKLTPQLVNSCLAQASGQMDDGTLAILGTTIMTDIGKALDV